MSCVLFDNLFKYTEMNYNLGNINKCAVCAFVGVTKVVTVKMHGLKDVKVTDAQQAKIMYLFK